LVGLVRTGWCLTHALRLFFLLRLFETSAPYSYLNCCSNSETSASRHLPHLRVEAANPKCPRSPPLSVRGGQALPNSYPSRPVSAIDRHWSFDSRAPHDRIDRDVDAGPRSSPFAYVAMIVCIPGVLRRRLSLPHSLLFCLRVAHPYHYPLLAAYIALPTPPLPSRPLHLLSTKCSYYCVSPNARPSFVSLPSGPSSVLEPLSHR